MIDPILGPARDAWAALQGHLFFLPSFPGRVDTLALLSLLLVTPGCLPGLLLLF